MSGYTTRLHQAIKQRQTAIVVGLDPRWEQLPKSIRERCSAEARNLFAAHALAYEQFCKEIIEVVAPLVPAVKPQAAFFEQCGPAGVFALRNVIQAAREAGLIVICDAKRGDIGSTAEAYAAAYLAGEDPEAAPFAADALTVNPYMGIDTLQPFVDRAEQVGGGLYVLVRTSNPGAVDFQDRETAGETLYQHVGSRIEEIAQRSAGSAAYGNIGAVVGATYPEELAQLRQLMPHAPLLVPGYGSQGGTSEDVAGGFAADGLGAIVNSSRGIIFAYQKSPWAKEFGEANWQGAVEAATHAMIADLKEHTTCSAL